MSKVNNTKNYYKKRYSKSQAETLYSKDKISVGIILTVIACLVITGATIHKIISLQNRPTFDPEPTAENSTVFVKPVSGVSSIEKTEEAQDSHEVIKSKKTSQNIQVQTGDNFWKISKRACGKGNYYLEIKADTGYNDRVLKVGDFINIDCSKYS